MKAIETLAILILIGIVSSYNNTSVLSNSTLPTLGYGDCMNITSNDSWSMICAPEIPILNLNITRNASDPINNSYFNATYNISFYAVGNQTINQTLVNNIQNCNATSYTAWANSTVTINNVSFSCLANITTINNTIIVNRTVYNNTCLKRNDIITLDYGENYTITQTNSIVRAPGFPSLNIDKNISFGDYSTNTYIPSDSRYNLTVRCSAISPYMCSTTGGTNIDRSMFPREVFFDQLCNITLRNTDVATDCTNFTDQLAFKETLRNDCLADLAKCNNNVLNLTSLSKIPPSYLKNCTTTITFCSDEILGMCKPEDVSNGNLNKCISGIVSDANASKSSSEGLLAKCQNDLTSCGNNQDIIQENNNTMLTVIGGAIFLFGGAFMLAIWLKRKKTIEGE